MGWQQEYLPEKIGAIEENKEYYENRDQSIIMYGEGVVTFLENQVPYLKFDVQSEGEVTIELPRIFYFGYVLERADGTIISNYENERGFVSAKVSSGTYELKYEGSLAYKMCLSISVITFLLLILFFVFQMIQKVYLQKRKN